MKAKRSCAFDNLLRVRLLEFCFRKWCVKPALVAFVSARRLSVLSCCFAIWSRHVASTEWGSESSQSESLAGEAEDNTVVASADAAYSTAPPGLLECVAGVQKLLSGGESPDSDTPSVIVMLADVIRGAIEDAWAAEDEDSSDAHQLATLD